MGLNIDYTRSEGFIMKRYIRSSEVYNTPSRYTKYAAYDFESRYLNRLKEFLPKFDLISYDIDLGSRQILIHTGDKLKFDRYLKDYGFDKFISFSGYTM